MSVSLGSRGRRFATLLIASFLTFIQSDGYAAAAGLTAQDLLRKVQKNADKIIKLEMTVERVASSTGGIPSPPVAREKYVYEPKRERVKIIYLAPVSGIEWLIDIPQDLFITRTPNGEVRLSVRHIAVLDPPSLIEFSPPPRSIFFPQLIYGDYELSIVGETAIEGRKVAIVRGVFPEAPQGGFLELLIEQGRGLLREERSFTASGELLVQVKYENYNNVGGVWLPLRLDERHFAQLNEVRVVHRLQNVSVQAGRIIPRGLDKAASKADQQGLEHGQTKARKRAAFQAGGEKRNP